MLQGELTFSQSSLQDFIDCPRRFELRYLHQLAWPAIQSEPVAESERLIQQGDRFHRLAHQQFLGIPYHQLSNLAQSDGLERWWNNFLVFIDESELQSPVNRCFPETVLITMIEGQRLVAKFDLVMFRPGGQITIYDWKTSQKPPGREWLKHRLQTRTYLFILTQAGDVLNHGKKINASQVDLVYWYPSEPDRQVKFPYHDAQYQEDAGYLSRLVARIQKTAPGEFALTQNERNCRYCVYRSLCNRGVAPGNLDDQDESAASLDSNVLPLDFDQIAEIEF
jgi:CRISPR/Cas system-associated exonuclease Cas4 (RecB family)